MSRFYNIEITGTPKPITYTSFPGGRNDPGALNVILDIFASPTFATPQNLASVQIWGLGLADLSQANNLTGKQIAVYAGFMAAKGQGLPLENSKQAGLICQGTIFQAFGNWLGTDMTLDLVIDGGGGTQNQPANIVFVWIAGTSLVDALRSTLSIAFPNTKQDISINPNLVLNHDETHVCDTMVQFAEYLKGITAAAIGGNYQGVDIILKGLTFIVYDGNTKHAPPKALLFQELIGQPTYINGGTIQFMCPMRADISVADEVTMPVGFQGLPGAVQTTTASFPQIRQKSSFSGTFLVSQVHHMGSFRQPDGESWVTVFNATAPV